MNDNTKPHPAAIAFDTWFYNEGNKSYRHKMKNHIDEIYRAYLNGYNAKEMHNATKGRKPSIKKYQSIP